MIAAYQIDAHQWDNARALSDAKAHGMAFFQFPRQNYMKTFQPRAINSKDGSPKTVEGREPCGRDISSSRWRTRIARASRRRTDSEDMEYAIGRVGEGVSCVVS